MSVVLTEDRGPVRVITLNRPERLNAITASLVEGLIDAVQAANADEGVRAVVLTGAGRAFCAGDDLHEIEEQSATSAAYVERLQQVTREIVLGRLPVVAAVHGWAVGGGFEWVLNCDLVVAGEGARGFFPEMALGLFVTGGVTALLPRIVGATRARELIMLGEHVDAARMKEWGIANWVVPDSVVVEEAVSIAGRLAELSPRAVADLRRVLNLVTQAEFDVALREETAATAGAFVDPSTLQRIEERRP